MQFHLIEMAKNVLFHYYLIFPWFSVWWLFLVVSVFGANLRGIITTVILFGYQAHRIKRKIK